MKSSNFTQILNNKALVNVDGAIFRHGSSKRIIAALFSLSGLAWTGNFPKDLMPTDGKQIQKHNEKERLKSTN